jgi:hypothetical protein
MKAIRTIGLRTLSNAFDAKPMMNVARTYANASMIASPVNESGHSKVSWKKSCVYKFTSFYFSNTSSIIFAYKYFFSFLNIFLLYI